ncbi:DNA translocase FtsK 4TM domain-containing protein [Shewanella surugensis]|uniref:DNA translocase FtsK n=1 Tax=Shewanella surugensis TaxID=212020 RepID=A0ABT0LGR0_9GAMM|nr:DNA translocase FtsK 4TM domain-containing protein [Shewanella surugensis]MCL1126878.1 DNA translocase FtsK 4TM domain-containing protein [Shewanella surugensis]
MFKDKSVKTLSGVQRLLEGSLILCCMVATFVLLALSSFHSSDPGWSQSNFDGSIDNVTGAVGAWIADVLLYFFGYTAYVIPIIIAATGWLLFKRTHKLLEVDYFSVGLRLVGFLLVVLSLGALESMNAKDIYDYSAGGVIGDVIAAAMLPYFNQLGTTLLLLCFVCAGLTLLTGISWLNLIDILGSMTIRFCVYLIRSPARIKAKRLDRDSNRESRDTQDTQGFMSLVENFKEKRRLGQAQKQALEQEEFDEEIADNAEGRIEPELSSYTNVSDFQSASTTRVETFDEDVIDFETKMSEGAVVASARRVNEKVSSKAKPVKKNNTDKAKIVDGIVILPGQDEAGEVVDMTPLPCISLLDIPNRKANSISQEELEQVGKLVELKLADFNIVAKVVGVYPGPVITRFELDLAPGIKASKISNLSTDLARSLLAESVRVVEVIPGKAYVGLELPNKYRETVFMRDVLDCHAFRDNESHLSMVLGQDIAGEPVVVDLGKMPHLLVAGTTGSGKSVGVNVMITSLLYKSGPDDVRFIMIDPKMLELSVYEGIPHLLCEVVTDMKEAANALRWCVGEMERRYKLMSALGVRNLKGYNAKIKQAKAQGEPLIDPLWKSSNSMEPEAPELEKLPSIVVVVDEFADMMMIVGKKVEELIARIAQKARAAGIHLILATQRPSVDVITGLIKANIPTRMAFQVSSRIDSRTILDQQGAETLLGMGDMLYLPPGTSVPIRVHGAFIDDHEVHKVVADWHARGKPQYIEAIIQGGGEGEPVLLPGEAAENADDTDALYDEAVAFVTHSRRGSISSVQRKFKIGYNRAARIIEQMEAQGVVSAQGHNGNREVLAPPPPSDF